MTSRALQVVDIKIRFVDDASHALHNTACGQGKADKKRVLGGRKALEGKVAVKKKGGLIGRKVLKEKVGGGKPLSDITDGVEEIDLNPEESDLKAKRLAYLMEEINLEHDPNCGKLWKESLANLPSQDEIDLIVGRMNDRFDKFLDSVRDAHLKEIMAELGPDWQGFEESLQGEADHIDSWEADHGRDIDEWDTNSSELSGNDEAYSSDDDELDEAYVDTDDDEVIDEDSWEETGHEFDCPESDDDEEMIT